MLDFFSIATKGGLVLWSKAYGPAQSSPINSLIQDILIEERSSTHIYYKDNYALKWTFVNDLDLIFIVRPLSCLFSTGPRVDSLNVLPQLQAVCLTSLSLVLRDQTHDLPSPPPPSITNRPCTQSPSDSPTSIHFSRLPVHSSAISMATGYCGNRVESLN